MRTIKQLSIGDNSKFFYYYGFLLFGLFFILFPFGQLLRIERYFLGFYFVIHPIDIVAILSLPFLFISTKGDILKKIDILIFIFIFSWVFSLTIFKFDESFTGFLYLFRIVSYYSFANMIYFLSKSGKIKDAILDIVTVSIVYLLFIGIFQLLFFPDLRDLYYAGWDNHLYRFTTTLLDPGYTSLVLIFGLLLVLGRSSIFPKFMKIILVTLFLIAIVLTFSRAGYLALFIFFLMFFKKYLKWIMLTFITALIIIFAYPKPHSSGVELYRTFSIISRIDNYKNTYLIFNKYPLFGIGFNNICSYRLNFLNQDNLISHSCSGSDSSLLLILSTTGIVGFIVLVSVFYDVWSSLGAGVYDKLLKYGFLIILVSSFFNNSFFYNFILGIFAVLLGISDKFITPDK